MKYKINFTINNQPCEHYVDANVTLLNMLRNDFDLTGAKEGCGAGECGACTVILDGEAVNACLVLACEISGRAVRTIEGISKFGELTPLQQSFIDHSALQCGFCTPGFIMSATSLLEKNPHPTKEQIAEGISGNLCRCTGYKRIIEAIDDIANPKGGAK